MADTDSALSRLFEDFDVDQDAVISQHDAVVFFGFPRPRGFVPDVPLRDRVTPFRRGHAARGGLHGEFPRGTRYKVYLLARFLLQVLPSLRTFAMI